MADERRHKSYRAWMLTQPCCCQPCVSPVIIHHHTAGETEQHGKSRGGKRGKGQRASDADGMPMCNHHHGDLHDRLGLSGFFADYDKHSRRKWQDDQVERLQRLYAMAYPEPLAPGAVSLRPSAGHEPKDSSVPRDAVTKERDRIVRVIRARAAERHHLPDQHQLLDELATDIAAGLNDTGAF